MNRIGRTWGWTLVAALVFATFACAQTEDDPASLVHTGNVRVGGKLEAYRIRHLPVQSFPELPAEIAEALTHRGCLIPQTYEARRPENVVRASLEHAGSSDWAVLCSVKGQVSLLVFFGSAPGRAMALSEYPELQRLQPRLGSEVLGFNWGIDPASPERIREAQTGMTPRPPRLDHDALADSVIDQKTVYHYFRKGAWGMVEMPVE